MINKKLKKKLLPLAVMTSVAVGSLGGTFSTAEAKEVKSNNAEIKNAELTLAWATLAANVQPTVNGLVDAAATIVDGIVLSIRRARDD